ncbi:hypothetical protein ONE63_008636 [Megalurothrips usitatus]|nr:hypothetical protein ONE63_008636 [Megalurothrips usitatus]KAJ1527098.1 hypothetical protein ONE63_008636 [Megalurothrips usitatus]
MGLKKRSSAVVEDQVPSKRRKEGKGVKEVEPHERKKNKKSKESKVIIPKNEPVWEEDEDDAEEKNMKDGASPWPEADLMELFNRIESVIPSDDSLMYSTRMSHVDWNEVAFNNYTPEECQTVMAEILKKVRGFRLMKEMISDARQWARKPWTSFYNKKSQSSHPEMPKRPMTQYMLFFMDRKDKVAAAHPNLDMLQVSKAIAAMWNELAPEKKKKWEGKAAIAREVYNEKLKKFYEKHPECVPNKDKNLVAGLRKPRTPKLIFIDDKIGKMENDPSFDRSSAIIQLTRKWMQLPDEKRLAWINKAVEEETKYWDAVKLQQAADPDFAPSLVMKTVLTKEEAALKDRAGGKPAKPPASAYAIFCSHMLSHDPHVKSLIPKDRMKQTALLWSEMSAAAKNEYQKKLVEIKEQYKLDFAAYLESLPDEERQEELMKTQTKKKPTKVQVNNGKDLKNSKPKLPSSGKPGQHLKAVRHYFPGEPKQPPVNPYDLFVESFVADTKLPESEAPRFWEMLPQNDKAKFHRKLKELKEKYIKDYKKFLKSLDEDEVAKYNELQKRNKEREAAAESGNADDSSDKEDQEDDSDEDDSSSDDEETNVVAKQENDDSDSDE